MKAWNVSDNYAEIGYIVFASTRNKARAIGKQCEGFDCTEYIDMTATRIPHLDGYQDEAGALDWNKHKRIYWNAKWYSNPDDMRCCDDCERYHYEDIPESLVGEDGLCVVCKAQNASMQTLHKTTNKGDSE